MRASAITAAIVATAALTFACGTAPTSSPTTTAAGAPSGDPATAHDAAGLVAFVTAAPAPPGATCATAQDLTSEGDVTRTSRALYSDADDQLVGQLTLQETEGEFVDVMLSNTVKRNSLDEEFPGIEGAKTRAAGGTPGSATDGTPVAFARGDTVVLLSTVIGREGDLAAWAPAVESYVTGSDPGTPLPACP